MSEIWYPKEASEETMQGRRDMCNTVEKAEARIAKLRKEIDGAPEHRRIAIKQMKINDLNTGKWLLWYEKRLEELKVNESGEEE
jgi:hypothetical protein